MTVQEADEPRVAEELPQKTEEVPDKRQTAYGTIYRPKHGGVQFLLLVTVFFGGPGVGWTLSRIFGLSETAEILFYVPFVAILFLGYGLWSARLQALAFETLGKGLLRTLFLLLVRRRKPESLQDVLPSPEQIERMAVRGQKASSSFRIVAVPVAAVAGVVAAFCESESDTALRIAVTSAACVLWGALLSRLARLGYLPILEGE